MNSRPNLRQPPERFAIVNGRTILPREMVQDQVMIVEGGRIVGIAPADSIGGDTRRLDAGGRYVSPGWSSLSTVVSAPSVGFRSGAVVGPPLTIIN